MTNMWLGGRHVGVKIVNSTHLIHKEQLNSEHFLASGTKQAGGKTFHSSKSNPWDKSYIKSWLRTYTEAQEQQMLQGYP